MLQKLNTIEFDNYYKSKYSIFDHFVLKENDFENYYLNSTSKSNPYYNINTNQFLIDDWRFCTTQNQKQSTNILKRVDSTKIFKLNIELKYIISSFNNSKKSEYYYTTDTLKLLIYENNYINTKTVNVKFTEEKNSSKELFSTTTANVYYKKLQTLIDNADIRYFTNQKNNLNKFRLFFDIDYLDKIFSNTIIIFNSTSNFSTNLEKDNLDNTYNIICIDNSCKNTVTLKDSDLEFNVHISTYPDRSEYIIHATFNSNTEFTDDICVDLHNEHIVVRFICDIFNWFKCF